VNALYINLASDNQLLIYLRSVLWREYIMAQINTFWAVEK